MSENTNVNKTPETVETVSAEFVETAPVPAGMTYEIGTASASAPVFSSLKTETFEDKEKIYNITNHPDYAISDYINKTIEVKDIYVDINPRLNRDEDDPNFGTYEDKPRTILIDVNGKSYISGVSIGIFQSVREIIRIFGHPSTWPRPIKVMPVNIKASRGNMLALEIVK